MYRHDWHDFPQHVMSGDIRWTSVVNHYNREASKLQIDGTYPSGKRIVKITCLNVPFNCLKYMKPMQLMWKSEIRSRPSDKSCRYSMCPTVIFTRLKTIGRVKFRTLNRAISTRAPFHSWFFICNSNSMETRCSSITGHLILIRTICITAAEAPVKFQNNTIVLSYYLVNRGPGVFINTLRPSINTLRPRQDGRLFPDDIFKCIFLNENVWIHWRFHCKFVPKGPINNIPALVQIMAWCRPGDKPLSEPMMLSLLTHLCVTQASMS